MVKKFLPVILALALALGACGLRISIPITQKVGPAVTDEFFYPVPAGLTGAADIHLDFGAGTLHVHGGTEALVTGSATYNIADFKPSLISEGSSVTIQQGDWQLTGIPNMDEIKNEWDIALGNVPINLTIAAGAYKSELELGGLALENLTIKDGAAQAMVTFSSPNTTEMNLLRYETGASNVSLVGLGNANFSSLEFDSGAGNYSLDFSGALTRDGSVNIQSGLSNLTLVIPVGVPAQITVEGGLSNLSHDSNWTRDGNVYRQTGSGHSLTIVVEMGAGNVTITK
jgi:hypothetical protein